jgi:hypothetical protein
LDREKSARRDLVSAFLKSKWPPSALLVTALSAHIEEDVLITLGKTSAGQKYMKKMEADLGRLEQKVRVRARAALSAFHLATKRGKK